MTKQPPTWRENLERLSGRIGDDLKSHRGPTELLEFLTAVSEAMALEEEGKAVPDQLDRRMAELRVAAMPYLSR